jgi:L-asparaginase/Glu-tRNA(Gln) amidotransferase subunit D
MTRSERDGAASRSVGLVITGGTIGASTVDSIVSIPTDDLPEEPPEVQLLQDAWQGRAQLDVHVRCPLRLLSENIAPRDWIAIAAAVRGLVEQEGVSGVIVLHGTDTMTYSAAALSFLLADVDAPVVLTGSNLPPSQPGSDAVRNVHDAVVAIDALGAGTYIVFAGAQALPGLVHLGTRVRKLQASGHAFTSVNRPLVGEVIGGRFRPVAMPAPPRAPRMQAAIDDRVLAVRLYPGLDLDALSAAVLAGDTRGVVVELYASATGPDTERRFSLPQFIGRCNAAGVFVATAIAVAPEDEANIYETTVAIDKAGGVFMGDMLPEVATVKLMWALAQADSAEQVAALMLRPIAGEMDDAQRRSDPMA